MKSRSAVIMLITVLLAALLSGCGSSPVSPSDDAGEEPERPVSWVIEPTDLYTDISEISIDFGFYASRENRDYYEEYGSCVPDKTGYPQQWYDGIMREEESWDYLGTFSYDTGVICVRTGDGESARWGVIDYEGNIRHSVDLDSPVTGRRLANIQGIGYRDMTVPPEIPVARYIVLSADYSRPIFGWELPTGVGLSRPYFFYDNQLYRHYYEPEVVEIPEEFRGSLVKSNNELPEKNYDYDGYLFVTEENDLVPQDGYYLKEFVNGFYIALEDKKDKEIIHVNDDYSVTYLKPKCIIKASTGRRITDLIYDDALYFEEGFCPVKRDGKWGLINEDGEEVTDMVFDKISSVYEGKVAVMIDGRFGIFSFGDGTGLTKEAVRELLAQSSGD